MSVTVALHELRDRVAEFGAVAFLVTVAADRRPHLVSVDIGWDHDELLAGAGRTTSANIAGHPDVSLLWPPAAGGGYSLIVDGTAEVHERDATTVALIRPSRAVLHRMAGSAGDGPSCITVL